MPHTHLFVMNMKHVILLLSPAGIVRCSRLIFISRQAETYAMVSPFCLRVKAWKWRDVHDMVLVAVHGC